MRESANKNSGGHENDELSGNRKVVLARLKPARHRTELQLLKDDGQQSNAARL